MFIAFDILLLDGKDMRAHTTLERRLAPSIAVAGASAAIVEYKRRIVWKETQGV